LPGGGLKKDNRRSAEGGAETFEPGEGVGEKPIERGRAEEPLHESAPREEEVLIESGEV